MSARLTSVNITAVIHEGDWTGSVGRTGIDKRPVAAVDLTSTGVVGDHVLDTKVHGGIDKAVYAYSTEDSNWWESRIEASLSPGSFGENLTTQGIDLTEAVIGERWRIGSALLEVSEPRIPCRVFAGFWKRPSLIKDFTEAVRPGAYLRVIESGEVSAGDSIIVLSKPAHGFTIGKAFEARNGNRDFLPQVLDVPDLPISWHEWANRILNAS
ncbi:MAG TPA: MOSC domain-containing protein [Candidatus Nanopelagicaceae bacterium]|nr:MOSC domain-containing protein [Candidatus Nanopelagicaceae bacterium]